MRPPWPVGCPGSPSGLASEAGAANAEASGLHFNLLIYISFIGYRLKIGYSGGTARLARRQPPKPEGFRYRKSGFRTGSDVGATRAAFPTKTARTHRGTACRSFGLIARVPFMDSQ